jgi:transposase InsO family protein
MLEKKEFDGLRKYEIIAPLLLEGQEPAEKSELRQKIMRQYGISERTLRRWVQKYREKGFDGLVTEDKSTKGSSVIPKDILDKAIELKEELPERSVRRIITIMEGEKLIEKDSISKSTLTRQLFKKGYGSNYKKIQTVEKSPARRFQRKGRNTLWMTDIKYGPYLLDPDDQDGSKRTYILSIIDDATRNLPHSEIYDNQKLPILEDSFRKALLSFGKPDSIMVDNGKIFISEWFRMACARLGIKLIRSKPYHPQGKGKIEKFNDFLNEFIQEQSLEPSKSLSELNSKFQVWLEEGYLNKPHSAINGMTPAYAYRSDSKKITFVTPEQIYELFLWEEDRKVDNSGVLSFKGNFYDAGAELALQKVSVRYDPFNLSELEIWDGEHGEHFVKKVKLLVIGEELPKLVNVAPKTKKATNSRLLSVYKEQNEERDKKRNDAISFRSINKKEDK